LKGFKHNKNFAVKQQTQVPIKRVEVTQQSQRIEPTPKEEEITFARLEREFALYSASIDKLEMAAMYEKREMVKRQQLLCMKYEELIKERDALKAQNETLIKRILALQLGLIERSEELTQKPANELLQFLQANLFATVDKEGVKKIPVQKGTVYDPLTCEAFPEEVNNDLPEGTIVREIAPGYFCGAKKLVSAKVAVTKRGEVVKN
jgi:molecular chaperone GrpE (heat shock protein)